MSLVRTNIRIENDYVDAIMKRCGVRTKTEGVDLALRYLACQPMNREDAITIRGIAADPPAADMA